MERIPRNGEFYHDLNNNLYQVVTAAKHAQTEELLVVYQALYGEFGVFAAPLAKFCAEMKLKMEQSKEQKENPQQTQPQEELCGVNPKVLEFLDTEDFDERYNILVSLRDEMNDQIIDTLSIALDVVIPEGRLEERYQALKSSLRTRQKYETMRLR